MFYWLRNVCILFYSSKTISVKCRTSLIKQLQTPVLHAIIAPTWYHYGVSGTSFSCEIASFVKISPFGRGENRLRVQRFINSVRSVYMQIIPSDNLQSQLIFKPPNRMSHFVSDSFNTFCLMVCTMPCWAWDKKNIMACVLSEFCLI